MTTPGPEWDLRFAAPIGRWDEALPLGNGMTGALIWGDGQPLVLSLDRADLWDLRPVPEWQHPECNYATMRRWVAEGRLTALHRLFAEPYDRNPGPTKIPAGRLVLRTPAVQGSRLRLTDATASVALSGGANLEIITCATAPVGCLRCLGGPPPEARLEAPAFGGPSGRVVDSLRGGPLAALGYGAAQPRAQGHTSGFLQRGWGGFAYALALAVRPGPVWEAAWAIATNREAGDPWAEAAARAEAALASGFAALHRAHAAWWATYWERAQIEVPDPAIQRQWLLDTYKFGAAARRGAPPISLQAVWTADEGGIPPWKGDYHHDLNTELCYWPCYSGNRLEAGLGFLDWLWDTRGEARAWTRSFWNLPGLNVPMTADLLGRQMGGWEPYAFSATTGAWLAQHFHLHWRFSQDRDFLAERGYPYLAEVCAFLEAVTEKGTDGLRRLPLSSSPEIFDNRLEAFMPPTTNYDLALLRFAFSAAAEEAAELGREGEARRWSAVLGELPDFSRAKDGRLLVAPGLALPESHRHFSHLLAIHPLGLLTWEGSDDQRQTLRAAMAELEGLGTAQWCGYSYAWLASLAARARDGERAAGALRVFAHAFCSPNSFHLNGDQTASGYSNFTYRPFTLEGNCAAAAGLQEMLLQGHGGRLRVFPAVPATWTTASFSTLRADGAVLVSARREGGRTVEVRVRSEVGGTVALEDPFPPGAGRLQGPQSVAVRRQGGFLSAELPPGAELTWKA